MHVIGRDIKPLDTLRYRGRERDEIMRKLKLRELTQDEIAARRSVRGETRGKLNCSFSYADKLDRDIWFKSDIRDLSNHGVGLLHGAFVYPDTHVYLRFVTSTNEAFDVYGYVRRCTFVAGRTHEIGVEFEEPIDVSDLIVEPAEDTGPHAPRTLSEKSAA